MTFLTILSLVFLWLIARELINNRYKADRFDKFNLAYLAFLILLTVLTAWQPLKLWRLESFLADKASELADIHPVTLHCNSVVDSIFDNNLRVIGHANYETGEIVFQHQWCENIMGYLDHPEKPSVDELWSLALFTHETMHIRGEFNEHKTECQALQRNHISAKLLGVPEHIARKNALDYYQNYYPRHPYYNPKCAPGKEYDENLDDSFWKKVESPYKIRY